MNLLDNGIVNVRYMVENVNASVELYIKYLGFTLLTDASPAFAAVKKGNLSCF